jgi:hypothetical protein
MDIAGRCRLRASDLGGDPCNFDTGRQSRSTFGGRGGGLRVAFLRPTIANLSGDRTRRQAFSAVVGCRELSSRSGQNPCKTRVFRQLLSAPFPPSELLLSHHSAGPAGFSGRQVGTPGMLRNQVDINAMALVTLGSSSLITEHGSSRCVATTRHLVRRHGIASPGAAHRRSLGRKLRRACVPTRHASKWMRCNKFRKR